MTVLQLSWLENYLNENSYDVIKGNMIDQLKLISDSEVLHVMIGIERIQNLVLMRALMVEVTLGFSSVSNNYFEKATAINSKEVGYTTFNYSYGYHSRFSDLSEEGEDIVSRMAGLNPILGTLFEETMTSIYEGFYTDEILNFSPLVYFDDSSYSPLNREWFYKAVDTPKLLISTEPYFDYTTNQLIITVSKAILKNSTAFGVVAADISIAQYTKTLSNIRVTSSGRVFLVSAGGIIMNPHPSWEKLSIYRIYNESLTGIKYSVWEEMKKQKSGSEFEMDITGFGRCFLIINIIKFGNETQYFMFSVIQKSSIQSPTKKLEDSFKKIYNYLFWSVIIISAIFLLISIVLIYYFARSATKKFSMINQILEKVKGRACFQYITRNCSFEDIKKNDSGVKTLVENCEEKINFLTEKEQNFKYFKWDQTRPSNAMLHSRWKRKIYPFNKYSEKDPHWNRAIDEIGKLVG
jgi:hypothetical protein